MNSISTVAKKSKFIHSLYKFTRDQKSIPPERWSRVPEVLDVFRVLPNTMLPMRRLFDTYDAVRAVNSEDIAGDVVECGVWNGGCIGLMALAHGRTGGAIPRRFHLFDSFEGLPPPSPEDAEMAAVFMAKHPDLHLNDGAPAQLIAFGACAGENQEEVERFLTRTLKIDHGLLEFHVGWFQDTVPAAREIGRIAILRLDGDWHESTRVCIEGLYDRVSPRGFVIIDDYGTFSGCRKAIDDFFTARGIRPDIHRTDADCIYFRKT